MHWLQLLDYNWLKYNPCDKKIIFCFNNILKLAYLSCFPGTGDGEAEVVVGAGQIEGEGCGRDDSAATDQVWGSAVGSGRSHSADGHLSPHWGKCRHPNGKKNHAIIPYHR